MNAIRTSLGGLNAVVVDSGDASKKAELAVILCHGFGAPGHDLVGVGAEVLQSNPALAGRVRFVFPEGPLDLAEYGGYGARAWWMIDMMRLQLLQTGAPEALEQFRRERPDGLAKSRRLLRALLDEVLKTTGLSMSRVVLGGFSQGAMLTTDLTLRLEEPPAALAIFSGALIQEEEWVTLAERRRGLRVLQSHGRQDPLLPFSNATALRDLFTRAGLDVDFVPFDGPHTIPAAAIEKLAALVAAKL